MAMIPQSIESRVPVHTAYHHPTRFKEYPRFMQEADADAEGRTPVPYAWNVRPQDTASDAVGKHKPEYR